MVRLLAVAAASDDGSMSQCPAINKVVLAHLTHDAHRKERGDAAFGGASQQNARRRTLECRSSLQFSRELARVRNLDRA